MKAHSNITWRPIVCGLLTSLSFLSAASAQPAPTAKATATVPGANPMTIGLAVPTGQPTPLEEPASVPVGIDAPNRERYNVFETITLSIFNKHAPKREWTPLYADTFFTEGWLEPHIGPPGGPGGSVRQGWVGVPEAFFNRQLVGLYTRAQGKNGRQNEQVGASIIESPISRRWDVGFIVPFVDDLQGANKQGATSFADTLIENRFLVHETPDLSVSVNINVRVPTGSTTTGNGKTVLQNYLAWYKDLGYKGWSFRGAIGATEPLSGPSSSRTTTLFQSVGIGQTLTPHDIGFGGDFTYYLVANITEDLDTKTNAFMSLTPGIRTHLGNNWFFLAGVDFPLTPDAGFRERFTVVLVKGF